MRFKALKKINRYSRISILAFLLVALSFLIAPEAFAAGKVISDWAGIIVGGIIYIFIWALGLILILVMKVLLMVVSYQNFIGAPAVEQGWTIVRDLANMFFVVILLVIAFATILRIESYNYKKWLPKLVLMAILINFSKTICGLLIDVSQIVMLTFVNSFKEVAGGNLVEMLGIKDVVTFARSESGGGFWTIVGAYILGLIYMIIALVVLTTMLMMLVMRIVMIWIYVVLSPLAYLLAAFPGGAQYASKWWKDFTSNLIIGPLLAFFIWLSFAALQTGVDTNDFRSVSDTQNVVSSQDHSASVEAVMVTEASTPGVLIKFVIAIGMLIGGMKLSQEMGGVAGSVAGKGMAKLNSMGAATGRFGKKWAGKIASGDNLVARKLTKAMGVDLRPGSVISAVKAGYAKSKKDDEDEIKDKGIENLRAGGARAVFGGAGAGEAWANDFTSGFLGIKGIINAAKEVAVRPQERKAVKKELDEESDKLTQLKQDQSQYITSKTKDDAEKEVKGIDREIRNLEFKIESGEITLDSPKYTDTKNSIANLSKKKEAIQASVEGKTVDDNKHKELSEKVSKQENLVSKKREELSKMAPPQALEGRSHYRKVINERKDQLKDRTNADELIKIYEDAVRRNDRFDQTAILEKLTNDGNLNEILRAKGYASNSKGMYDFLRNNENEKGERRGLDIKALKLDESQILQIQNDLSEAAERVGHWEFAKTVGVNNKGDMESLVKYEDKDGEQVWNDDAHVIAAATEVAKMDPQKQVMNLGRLAYGGEDADGNFELSNLGRVLTKMMDQSNTYDKQQGRVNQNIAINLTIPKVKKELEEIGVSKATLDVLSKIAGSDVGSNINPSLLLENVKKTEKAKESISDLDKSIS